MTNLTGPTHLTRAEDDSITIQTYEKAVESYKKVVNKAKHHPHADVEELQKRVNKLITTTDVIRRYELQKKEKFIADITVMNLEDEDKLHEKIKKLEKQLFQDESEIRQLKQNNGILIADYEMLETQLHELERKSTAKALPTSSVVVNVSNHRRIIQKGNHTESNNEAAKLKGELNKLSGDIFLSKKQHEITKNELEDLKTKHEKTNAVYLQLKTDHQLAILAKEESELKSRQLLEKESATSLTLKNEKEDLQRIVQQANARIAELEAKDKKNQDLLVSKEKTIADFEAHQSTLKSFIDNIKQEAAEHKLDFQSKSHECEILKNENETLKTDRSKNKEKYEQLIKEHEQTLEKLQRQEETLQKTDTLKRKLEEILVDVEQLTPKKAKNS